MPPERRRRPQGRPRGTFGDREIVGRAESLGQIAAALRISAEQLYIRAGILSPEDLQAGSERSVELAVLADSGLTERQKQSLLDVYASFLALNGPVEDDDR